MLETRCVLVGFDQRSNRIDRSSSNAYPRDSADVVEVSHSTFASDSSDQRRLSIVQERSHPFRCSGSSTTVCQNWRCLLYRSWIVSTHSISRLASLSPSLRINQTSLVEATEHLLQAFYGFEASLVKVTCQIEVSEQYHIYLQTRQPSKEMCIAAIEQYTHTSIQFPMNHLADEQTMSSNGNARRTSVTITGSPAQVCQARKLFDVSSEETPFSVLMYVSLGYSSYVCRSF